MPGMANLFRSARLVYRAIEDTPEDEAFMHSIQSDVEAYANSSSSLLVPETKAHSREWKKHVEGALIGTIVCLAPPPPPAPDGTGAPALSSGGFGVAQPAPVPQPTPIGCLSLTKGPDPHHRNAYISIDIVAGYRGKGYGSEAIRWVLDWGFRIAGLHRVGIEAYSWNQGANDLYTKLGFTFEGRKRHLFWYDGGWHDLLSYSILEDEWRELQKKDAAEQ